MEQRVAVAYLVWVPFGIGVYNDFLQSYIKNNAGSSHTLLLLFNGVKNTTDIKEFVDLTNNSNITNYEYLIFEKGQDMEVYQWSCSKVDFDVMLFLNSYSTFNTKNWLKIYLDNFNDAVGMIGASASNQSIYSSVFKTNTLLWEFNKSFNYNYRKYKLLIKAFCYWRFYFKPFPCPHIRATAYMIRRKDYLEIKSKFPLNTKFDAYKVECGYKSITNQLLKKGYQLGVVNCDGKYFDLNEAKQSLTFRTGNQEKLLINDKQTNWYSNADKKEKTILELLAWGNYD
jgi:hypothetical protein